MTPHCDACVAEWEQRQRASQHDTEQRRVEALFSMADFGARYRSASFALWERRPGTEVMLNEARAMVSKWPAVQGLAFIGPEGVGKTHVAAIICNELRPRGVGCVMRSVPELLNQLRDCYGKRTSVVDKLQMLIEADLIVLDDLGAERLTESNAEWVREQLFMLIDRRYRTQRPIIITSNLPLGQLEARIGERSIRRLVEMCRVVSVEATSYRVEQARARLAGRPHRDRLGEHDEEEEEQHA